MSAHLPDAHEKTTPFYGWYSHRTRGYRRRHGLLGEAHATASTPERDAHASLEARRSWARLIRQVYEVDPLLCARCGATMKVIAVIERQGVVRQILAHLGLPTTVPGLRGPPHQLVSRVADPPREGSYEPIFDDLPIPDPPHGLPGPRGRIVRPGH